MYEFEKTLNLSPSKISIKSSSTTKASGENYIYKKNESPVQLQSPSKALADFNINSPTYEKTNAELMMNFQKINVPSTIQSLRFQNENLSFKKSITMDTISNQSEENNALQFRLNLSRKPTNLAKRSVTTSYEIVNNDEENSNKNTATSEKLSFEDAKPIKLTRPSSIFNLKNSQDRASNLNITYPNEFTLNGLSKKMRLTPDSNCCIKEGFLYGITNEETSQLAGGSKVSDSSSNSNASNNNKQSEFASSMSILKSKLHLNLNSSNNNPKNNAPMNNENESAKSSKTSLLLLL